MSNFCSLNSMSIFQNTEESFDYVYFRNKISILYPIIHLKLAHILWHVYFVHTVHIPTYFVGKAKTSSIEFSLILGKYEKSTTIWRKNRTIIKNIALFYEQKSQIINKLVIQRKELRNMLRCKIHFWWPLLFSEPTVT